MLWRCVLSTLALVICVVSAWSPYEYFPGEWVLRRHPIGVIDHFTRSPNEVHLNLFANTVYEALLLGQIEFSHRADLRSYPAMVGDPRGEAEASPKPPMQSSETPSLASDNAAFSLKIEFDGTGFGATVAASSVSPSGFPVAPDGDDNAAMMLSSPISFMWSQQGFHHFKVATGSCPPRQRWPEGNTPSRFQAEIDSVFDFFLHDKDRQAFLEAQTGEPQRLRWCSSYQLTVLDDNYFLITLLFRNSTGADDTATIIARRKKEIQEDLSWTRVGGTIALLIVVAAVRFLPSLYLRRRGIDPRALRRTMFGGQRARTQISPEQRAKLLAKQREIIEAMKREDEAMKVHHPKAETQQSNGE